MFSPEHNNSPLFQEFTSGIGSAPIGSLTGLGFGGGVRGETAGE